MQAEGGGANLRRPELQGGAVVGGMALPPLFHEAIRPNPSYKIDSSLQAGGAGANPRGPELRCGARGGGG